MLQKLLFLLPLVVAVLALNKTNNGIQYDGTSNVRISPNLNYQPQRITPAPPFLSSMAPFATSPAVYPSSQWYPPGYRPFLQPHPNTQGSQSVQAPQATMQPGMSASYPYSPDQFNASIPTLPGQHLKPGVIYEPKIIFVPKTVQPTSKTGVAADQPSSVSSQPAETAKPEIIRQPAVIPHKEIAQQPEVVKPTFQPTATAKPQYYTPSPALGAQLNNSNASGSLFLPNRPTHPPPMVYYPTLSYPSKSYPPAQVVTKLPPKAVTREPTQVVIRLPPKKVTPTPPKVVIKTPRPRPTGPFATKFQCPESNGFFSAANSCDAYFECKGYVPEKRICPNGLYFNPAAKYSNYSPCSHPSEVQCTAGNVIQRWPTNPTDQCPAQFGYFAINDGDCSRYIVCQEGLATIMNCPMGLVFNDQIQSCDWPVNVPQCTPSVFKDFTCPAPPVERNGEISDLIYKYRYGSQCTSFVACQNGRPRLLSCDPGLAFDETSQSCISEQLVTNCAAPYPAAIAA